MRTLKALKLRRANLKLIFALRNFGAFKVRPAELWNLRSAPRGVLVAKVQNNYKNHLKLKFPLFSRLFLWAAVISEIYTFIGTSFQGKNILSHGTFKLNFGFVTLLDIYVVILF